MQDENLATVIRRLMRRVPSIALGTTDRDDGAAYVSLAMVALDHDAAPLLLLSNLADHTRNIGCDPRVSLLFDGTGTSAVMLAGERATLQGTIAITTEGRHRERYLARHPDAAAYIDFGDFNLYRVTAARFHLVAGFGRIHWVAADAVLTEVAELAAAEPDILAHMNTDHADAVQLYAHVLLGRTGSSWQLTGIDPDGTDLRCGTDTGRLDFEHEVHDAEAARAELVRLVKVGRARQAA